MRCKNWICYDIYISKELLQFGKHRTTIHLNNIIFMLFAAWKTGAICHTRRKIKRHAAGYNTAAGRHSHDLRGVLSWTTMASLLEWMEIQ